MVHRLLAMNIDGTILQSNGKLQKSVRDAVEYLHNKGIYVTLVTSRNFSFAKRIAKALKITSMIVSHHGAFIASSIDQAIFIRRINDEMIHDIVTFLESYSCHIRLIDEKLSVSNQPVEQKNRIRRTIIDPFSFALYHHQYVEQLSTYLKEKEEIHPTHMEIIFFNEQEAKEAKLALNNMFFEIELYQYGNQLVILPKGVSKLSGLIYLGDFLGISREEMVVIGSDWDDSEMIEAAGLGVAMGNAPEDVKKLAGWITRSNTEDGVYYMVREHFRKQQPLSFLEKLDVLK